MRQRYRNLRREERKGYFKLRRLKLKITELYNVDLSEDQSCELEEFVGMVKEQDVDAVLDDVIMFIPL